MDVLSTEENAKTDLINLSRRVKKLAKEMGDAPSEMPAKAAADLLLANVAAIQAALQSIRDRLS